MNFPQWFQSWFRDRRTESPATPDHAARLSIRRLEERQVYSVGAILAGFDVTFTGDDGGASSDSLVFTIDGSGNLEHNLGGINGFHSNIDLDNLTAGDQSLTIGQIENLNILLGDDADSVQFGADFDFSSGNLSIAAESITAFGGSLTAQGTTLDAGSANDITLDQANDFYSVTIVSARDVTLNDTSDLILEGESTVDGNLSITSSGTLSNTDGAVVTAMGHAHFEGSSISLGAAVGALSVTVKGDLTVTATTGDITITSPLTVTGTSEFSTLQSGADINLQNLAASSSVTVQTVGLEGDVSIGSTANLQLQGTVNGHLVANVSGDLTDSGTLHVTGNTTITATGDVIWHESANDFVGAVSVAAQAVQIHDANAILLREFDATSITITAGGPITLGTGSGEQVTATGTVSLTASSGGVSQATGTEIQASALLLQGTGPFALNEVNQIGTLAAEITGPLSLANATDLTIGTVNGISGISSTGHDVKLANQGNLTIEQAISLGAGDLFLDVDGDVAQAGAGTIHASGLALMVDGTSTFGLDNDVDRLAADVGGTLVFHDINGLTIGSVAEEASPSLMALQGITSSDDAVTVTTSTGDLILERAVHLSTGDLTLEATTGRILDGLDGQTLLTARNLSLTAASHIGEITDFATGTGNAIDVALSGQLTSASINATSGQIFVIGQGDLTAATGSVNVGGANAASAILRSVGGNLDVGTAPGVFTLSTGDHLRLEAIKVGSSGGTLVLPDAGLNVGTGDLWLQGDADIVDTAGRQLGPLVADDLRFISGGSGGDTTVETQINTLTATITGAGSALTINEADGLTLVDTETTDGDFTVHASQGSAGDITVGNITAGQARVTMATVNHGGGQIIDGDSMDNSLSADISASAIDLLASTGIANNTTLEVEAEQLAAITSSGDINVRDLSGDLAIATLADGTAGVTISDGISGDDIAITTVGALDVEAAVLNEGTGIREILLAADGATTTNDLTLKADVTGRGGDVSVTLLAGDTISLSGTTTVAADGAGSVRVAAGRVLNHGGVEGAGTTTGHLLMADGSIIQSAGGDIHLAAPGEVQLSVVNAGSGPGGGDLFITADADQSGTGAITEVLSGENSNLIADRVTLLAATGIGSGGATADIDTSVETLIATNTHSGAIQIHETDSLTIAGSGVRTLNGDGAVRVQVATGELVVDAPVTAHGAGSVTLLADQGPVIINADVRSTTGAITIGGHEVLQNAMLATGGTGSVVVTAQAGSITMSDGASTETDTGVIRYTATNDVALSLLSSTTGDLFVAADSDGGGTGAITDNTASETPLLVTSGTATLSAAMGIGDGQAIDTAIGELTATNSTSGDIQFREVDDLVIVGPGISTTGGSGNIAIDVQQGNLVVDGAVTAHENGNITLTVDQGGLSLYAEVTSTTGDIGLTADQVQQNLGGNIRTGSGPNSAGSVSVIADNGSLTMADGTTTTTSTGTIQYEATGQVALSQLISTSGDLVVSAGRGASTVGAITDNTASESPNLVTMGRATLIAETGIGSAGGALDIDTSVAELSLTNSTSGNIVLTEANVVTVVHLSQAGGGDASLQTANGTLTVDNAGAAPQAITIADGGRLILAASGSQSDLIVNDGVQARGGNITLLASRDVTANSAPITSIQGNGDITVQAGRDIKILDAGNRNPEDMSVAGSGTVRLNAANQLVLGSQNPTTASNQTQHTVPNDVLIKTQTGSITNTLPLAYDLQSPQITALGEAVLSITIGRPGDTNLTVRIFWGDGSVRTITGLSYGTHPFSYFYQGNPDAFNPSSPILINVQVAHDPQIVLRAPNLNSPVGFIVNSAIDVPPPIPAQNINADLASALYDSTDPLFGTLQSQVVTRPGTEAAPGAVVFQDTSVRATLVPVTGDGLASFVFDTTPPVVHLSFPEAPKIIDTQSSSGVQLSEGTLNQNDAVQADESLSEERVVVLEILSPDGTVQQQVILPESTLDQMHEVIGKLPDGAYRFLLREPGEDRMRLLLEFDVRQGKISNETEGDDRPPSSAPKAPTGEVEGKDPSDAAAPAEPVAPAPAPMDDSDAVQGDTTAVETLVDVDQDEAVSPPQRSGWSSVAARRAWQRGAEPLPDETSDPSATTDDTANNEPSEAAWAGCTVAVIGASVTIGTRTPANRGSAQTPLARLNRGAQLLRKFAPFEK